FLSFLLCFSCYRPLRVLHSFPTRRSSDLAASLALATAMALLARIGFHVGKWITNFGSAATLIVLGTLVFMPMFNSLHAGTAPFRDRKSTRLNSSHGSISYAVFCLKKKKIN